MLVPGAEFRLAGAAPVEAISFEATAEVASVVA